MIYILHFGIAIVAFLVMLNGYLRGAKKHQIDVALSLALLGILLTVLLAFGWKTGFLAVLFAFVYAAFSRPFAARIAARLMSFGSGPSGTYLGLPPRSLERISRELGREVKPEVWMRELMATPNHRQQAEDALFDHCLAQPAIQSLVQEFAADRATLKDLYATLCMAGAAQWAGGHWVAASALAYPNSLRFLLTHAYTVVSAHYQMLGLAFIEQRGKILPAPYAAVRRKALHPVPRSSRVRKVSWQSSLPGTQAETGADSQDRTRGPCRALPLVVC